MWEAIKNNPVRVMEVVTAVCALLTFYFGNVPWPLVIAVFSAIVGGGEAVRRKVTPMRKLTEVTTFLNGYPNLPDVENHDKVYVWKP